MSKKNKKRYYAVVRGRVPGIYEDFELAKKQVDKFPNALFRRCKTKTAAQNLINSNGTGNKKQRYYAVVKGRIPGIYTNITEYSKQVNGFSGSISKKFKTEKEAKAFIENDGREVLSVSEELINKKIINTENKTVKKYYAVARGYNPGIYMDYKQAEKQVKGFPRAVLKSFKNQQDAQKFFNSRSVRPETNSSKEQIVAYVDGSFDEKNRRCGWGVVLLYNNKKYTYSGSKQIRKDEKTGSCLAELEAAKRAIKRVTEIRPKPESVLVHYDSEVIKNIMASDCKIKRNLKSFKPYRDFYNEKSNFINVDFIKVPAHSGVVFNHEADRLARKAIGLN